ncbi:hypothetical protein [Streptomyces sp. Y1]|uniref:Uncharacterized protein n=1 Tax=Streptomyces sp. Y1 TaxID=3238634 RepID=A0AB39TJN9_9ACTN
MVKRPTPPPLTTTERARLDHLVRRAAARLTPDETGLLMRLWEHDQADREQERRSTGGLQAQLRRLTALTSDTR